MNIVEALEQGTPEWLSWRQSRRMASETPAVTRRSPYQTWEGLRKVKRGEQTFQTAAMAHGHTHEHDARLFVAAETGLLFVPAVVEEGEYAASLDGLDGNAIAEIKCPYKGKQSDTWQLAERGLIRPDYDDQIIHQMAVSGASVCYFTVYDAESEHGIVIERQADPELWKKLQAQWDEFWPWHLTDDPDPAINLRTDEAWRNAAAYFTAAKRQADSLAKIADDFRAELIRLAGDDSAIGAGVKVTRFEKKGGIDYKKATAGLDVEQYRKPATFETRITID